MAITFQRVQIRNIRSVEALDLQFHPDGVTAIIGPTGAGKSTVMAVMAWVLYGESRTGALVQAEARRDFGVAAGDPCEGIVYFTVDGNPYTARRSLSRSRKGKETAAAQMWVGHDITADDLPNITPTTLSTAVKDLTGLSGRAFAGAFYMPQNQLESLAVGTPTEVQDLFEEQTGLTGLTRKVDLAGQSARDAAKTADMLPGSQLDAQTAAGDAAEADTETARLAAAAAAAQTRAEALSRQAAAAQDQLDGLTTAAEHARATQDAVTAADAVLHQAQDDSAAAVDAAQVIAGQGFPDLAAADAADQAAQDKLAEITQTGMQLRRAQSDVTQAHTELGAAPLVDLAAAEASTQQAVVAADQAAAAVPPRQAVPVRVEAEISRLDKALAALRAAAGDPQCPTCRQPLIDPSGLLAEMGQDRAELAAELITSRQQVQEAEIAARAARTAADGARRAEQGAARGAHRRSEAQRRLNQAESALAELLPDTVTTAEQVAAALLADHEKTTNHGRAARKAAEAHRAAGTAAARVGAARHRASAAQTAAAAVDFPDPQQIADARQQLTDRRTVFERARGVADVARRDEHSARTATAVLRQIADQRGQEWDRKAATLADAERATQVHLLLRAYREELLGEYTATVSDAATAILAQMGGEHIGFEVGPNFEPKVILTDGTARPTRVLSGGEKARAGLCFRLGIAEQITAGRQPGMLLTDEPTAAHDKDTRQAVMAALRSLGKPIVLISHAEEAADIADLVIRLDKVDRITTVRTAL